MKTNAFIETLNRVPEEITQNLLERHPELKTLEGKQLEPSLYGFNTSDNADLVLYNELMKHQKHTLSVIQAVKNELGVAPLAVIPMYDLRQMILKTPGILLFEKPQSNGALYVSSSFMYVIRELRMTHEVFKDMCTVKSFKEWLERRPEGSFNYSDTNENFFFKNGKEKPETLEEARKMFGSLRKYIDALRGRHPEINSPLVKSFPKMLRDCSELELRELFLETLYRNYRVSNVDISVKEIKKAFHVFLSDFIYAKLNAQDNLRIFDGNEKNREFIGKVSFVDAPLSAYTLLQNMELKKIQPVIVVEQKAVSFNFNYETLFPKPPCPIIGYVPRGTDWFAIMTQFGDMELEKQLVENAKKMYTEKFLGVGYQN